MFPEITSELLARVLPSGRGYNEGDLPWSRHQRRKVRKAQQVVIHLFSGKDANFWKKELEDHRRAVLCLDTELDSRQDLHQDDVMEFLLDLADSGRAVAWIGGPPCRAMSRLRYKQPGPPPLRPHFGHQRFGLDGLDDNLKALVEKDTLLWLRHYYLFHRSNSRRVIYLSEQPGDPEHYIKDEIKKEGGQIPTRWSFPLGHPKRKPTTLETNLYQHRELHNLRGPGTMKDIGLDSLTLEERIQQSRSWAAWFRWELDGVGCR